MEFTIVTANIGSAGNDSSAEGRRDAFGKFVKKNRPIDIFALQEVTAKLDIIAIENIKKNEYNCHKNENEYNCHKRDKGEAAVMSSKSCFESEPISLGDLDMAAREEYDKFKHAAIKGRSNIVKLTVKNSPENSDEESIESSHDEWTESSDDEWTESSVDESTESSEDAKTQNGVFYVVSWHGVYKGKNEFKIDQLDALLAILLKKFEGIPFILAGDFNLPYDEAMNLIARKYKKKKLTLKYDEDFENNPNNKRKPIDYFISGGLDVSNFKNYDYTDKEWKHLDHNPLTLQIKFPTPQYQPPINTT